MAYQPKLTISPRLLTSIEEIARLSIIAGGGIMHQGTPGRYRTIAVHVGRFVPPPAVEASTVARS